MQASLPVCALQTLTCDYASAETGKTGQVAAESINSTQQLAPIDGPTAEALQPATTVKVSRPDQATAPVRGPSPRSAARVPGHAASNASLVISAAQSPQPLQPAGSIEVSRSNQATAASDTEAGAKEDPTGVVGMIRGDLPVAVSIAQSPQPLQAASTIKVSRPDQARAPSAAKATVKAPAPQTSAGVSVAADSELTTVISTAQSSQPLQPAGTIKVSRPDQATAALKPPASAGSAGVLSATSSPAPVTGTETMTTAQAPAAPVVCHSS